MVKFIETTGRTEEDAISAALFQLGLERDDVSVEVVERAKSGFLGFGSNPAKVRVSYEDDNGVAKPIGSDEFKFDLFGETEEKEEPKAEPVEVKAEEPKAEPAVEPAPVVEAQPEQPAAEQAAEAEEEKPVEVETILAAKPGWQPPKQRQNRERRRSSEQLQAGDEIVMQSAPHPVKEITLTPAAEDDEKANKIRTFLVGLMEHMDVNASPDIFATSEGGYKVVLQGENLGCIIGRRGETLDAIQQLTNYAINHGQSKRVRVHVDAEGYRAKREQSLQRLAVKVAGKVVKYRKNMTLEPMNAYERHVIHTALQDYPGVTTYSTGVEPNRRTVVAYAPEQR